MKILSVSELNEQIKAIFEESFYYVSVCGEVSNCVYHTSGHVYFTLKDKDSTIKCVMFKSNAIRLKFQIKDGNRIVVCGSLGVYSPRGEYQINCQSAQTHGVGNLQEEFLKLKDEYQKKGYFDNKKKIPKYPRKIILLTSKTGDVINDMKMVALKRGFGAKFILINTKVQGEDAKCSIAKNISIADSLEADCIILARGGGSIEDLWAFNEREVVEAIFNAKTPIISAIGHEPDYVLSDYVASLRAPTPSAAISMIMPDISEVMMNLDSIATRFNRHFVNLINNKQKDLNTYLIRLNAYSLDKYIEKQYQKINTLKTMLDLKIAHKVGKLERSLPSIQELNGMLKLKISTLSYKLESLKAMLDSKNPSNIQKKGYVYAKINNKSIESLKDIEVNNTLILEDLHASLEVVVKSKKLL